jgi:hemolysin type calcium-binding protein
MVVRALTAALLGLAMLPVFAVANTSHAGWPQVTGMLLMNKQDQSRPLDGRPGQDPFDQADPTYSCDGVHRSTACVPGGLPFASDAMPCGHRRVSSYLGMPSFLVRTLCSQRTTSTVPAGIGHNELLGGHGSDVIHAGPAGDVLWGDYKPSGQPTTQLDYLYGGPGDDFIYASHGKNVISTGGGQDIVHAHFGHGRIYCDSSTVTVYLSRKSRKRYRLHGCRRISYATLGY